MKNSEMVCGTGGSIPVYLWEPDDNTPHKGIVQLIHGSCEHARRYAGFAQFLTEQGYVVYAHDLRGHGRAIRNKEDYGYFGEHGGWTAMVQELGEVTRFARSRHPGLKLVVLGHSMGSFLARHYALARIEPLDGLVLIGTAHHKRTLLRTGHLLARSIVAMRGSHYHSAFLYKLSYEAFNHRFEPSRTVQDWLTRDESVVDAFIRDESCGFVFSAAGFRDMFEGLLTITDPAQIRRTPPELPTLLLYGTDDPVGNFGEMVQEAYEAYQKAGLRKVKLKGYEGMRHEILNELGKEEVYRDLVEWLEAEVLGGNVLV
jgi:alpha-beta hydrolase superfamily lysophospholipase